MKPIFKCDYCRFVGTEEEVSKHEEDCIENYTKQGCWTCQHRGFKGFTEMKCGVGQEIPPGQMMQFCPKYERKETPDYGSGLNDIVTTMFGGLR